MSIKTRKCNIFIDNVTELFGEFDVESSSLNDFIQPAAFDAQQAIFPRGSRTPIVWVYYKDNSTANDPQSHKNDGSDELYTMDLVVAGNEEDKVLNVIPPTSTQPFWNRSDYTHSVIDFTMTDKTCQYRRVGVLVYSWRVPDYLDDKITYRLKLSTMTSNEEHLSGPLRIEVGKGAGDGGSRSRMVIGFGLVCLLLGFLVFSRWLVRYFRRRRRGYVVVG